MKASKSHFRMISILATAGALMIASIGAHADEVNTTKKKEKDLESFSGTATAVNPIERTVKAKAFLFTKTFNVGETCKVSLEDKPEATLSDLRPGNRITVRYTDDKGVLIACSITQHNRVYEGHVAELASDGKSIVVKRGATTKSFSLTDDCQVRLPGNKAGSMDDLKLGESVSVVFESSGDAYLARRINQCNPTFAGSVRAIDATARTIRVKHFLDERKFHLADGCRIIANNNTVASLKDLRIGDQVVVSYEDRDSVLVADRIGLTGEDETPKQTAQAH